MAESFKPGNRFSDVVSVAAAAVEWQGLNPDQHRLVVVEEGLPYLDGVPDLTQRAEALLEAAERGAIKGYTHTEDGEPADTQAMAHHLHEVSHAIPTGRHGALDRAGWHTTPKLPQCSNLSLLPLPAGSPELTPTEQVWQQLRERKLANRCFDGYDQIVDACCNAWNAFTQIPGAIRSLCARNWADLNAANVTL